MVKKMKNISLFSNIYLKVNFGIRSVHKDPIKRIVWNQKMSKEILDSRQSLKPKINNEKITRSNSYQ